MRPQPTASVSPKQMHSHARPTALWYYVEARSGMPPMAAEAWACEVLWGLR